MTLYLVDALFGILSNSGNAAVDWWRGSRRLGGDSLGATRRPSCVQRLVVCLQPSCSSDFCRRWWKKPKHLLTSSANSRSPNINAQPSEGVQKRALTVASMVYVREPIWLSFTNIALLVLPCNLHSSYPVLIITRTFSSIYHDIILSRR